MSMTRGASFNPTCCSCSHGHEMPAAYRALPVHACNAMQCKTLTTSLTSSFVFFTTSKQYRSTCVGAIVRFERQRGPGNNATFLSRQLVTGASASALFRIHCRPVAHSLNLSCQDTCSVLSFRSPLYDCQAKAGPSNGPKLVVSMGSCSVHQTIPRLVSHDSSKIHDAIGTQRQWASMAICSPHNLVPAQHHTAAAMRRHQFPAGVRR